MADGTVLHPDRFKQPLLFHGLRFGNKSPTDIDCVLEFSNKLFIFVEAKHTNTPIKKGQRLALERIVDAIDSQDKLAIGIIVEHDADLSTDIDISLCKVREYRVNKYWKTAQSSITLREAVIYLAAKCGIVL